MKQPFLGYIINLETSMAVVGVQSAYKNLTCTPIEITLPQNMSDTLPEINHYKMVLTSW